MTKSSSGWGGKRTGAGRKRDPEKKMLGRSANIDALFIPGDMAVQVATAIQDGDTKKADGYLEFFILKKHRREAMRLLNKVAAIYDEFPGLRNDSKLAPYHRSDPPEDVARREEARALAAEIIREVEEMTNPDAVASVANCLAAGVQLPSMTESDGEWVRTKAKLDVAKKAAAVEKPFWRRVRENRHKRAKGENTCEALAPDEEKLTQEIMGDYPGWLKKK